MSVIYGVVKGPCLTEKSNFLNETSGIITFKVNRRANKVEIRQAVEKLFDVKVARVRTSIVRGKQKRVGIKSFGRTKDWKKAYVTLSEGKIDFLTDL